jgi:hypothetical protein
MRHPVSSVVRMSATASTGGRGFLSGVRITAESIIASTTRSAAKAMVPSLPAPGSRPPPVPLQRVGGEAPDDAALRPRHGQLGGHHVSGAQRESALPQHLRDDGCAAKVNLERLAEVELG